MLEIRELRPDDQEPVLAMNNDAVPAVNRHDEQSLRLLIDIADRAWVAAGEAVVGGLLVGFAPGAPYESANYVWLSERYDNFGYVDRIVVARSHRRLGLAARLYETFADHARANGRDRLLCEVNVDPPNPQSMAFHEATGWRAVADLRHGPGKVVRFFELVL